IDPDDAEAVGQALGHHQVVERGHDQALGEIAAAAEDHHSAGRRHGDGVAQGGLLDWGSVVDHGFLLIHLRPSISRATATTWSGSKPYRRCSSLSGADAPKAFMPMTRPLSPT